jgi:glycosyltransferase involved in cell wall biosynthesis
MSGDESIVSVIVPVKNEKESLFELYNGIESAFDETENDFEIIMVDDGSTDDSYLEMEKICEKDQRVRAVRFIKNFGKSAALAAGFERAKGDIIITIDADLQDDPSEIPRFLYEIKDGAHLVTGWKKDRKDPFEKRFASKIANAVTSYLTGIKVHDMNCGFKAYRKEVAGSLKLYGDLHRFIPAMAAARGFLIKEIPVKHNPRKYGKSKYGMERLSRGFFDLLTVLFLTQYARRPLHLFGATGVFFGSLGFIALSYLSVLWLMGLGPIGTRPLFMGGVMLMLLGAQLLSLGLVGELITNMSFKSGEQYIVMEEKNN